MEKDCTEISRLLPLGRKTESIVCGMAHLLYELSCVVPGLQLYGIDISEYALSHAKEEIRDRVCYGRAEDIPFDDNEFDLVIFLTTLHNLKIFDLKRTLQEIMDLFF